MTAEDDREIVTPAMGLLPRAEHDSPQLTVGDVPQRVLVAWSQSLFEKAVKYARAADSGKRIVAAPLYLGTWGGEAVAVVAPGLGGPATALAVEKLIAAGARAFVGVGSAGSVHPLLASGSLLVVKAALRDEGVSAHYGATDDTVTAFEPLVDALELACGEDTFPMRCGVVWSTDAPYRETVAKTRAMRARGALAVEMECAALFSVAAFRGARASAIVTVTDELARFKDLDEPTVDGDDGIAHEWKSAPPGSLDREAGASLRAALAALAGDVAVQ